MQTSFGLHFSKLEQILPEKTASGVTVFDFQVMNVNAYQKFCDPNLNLAEGP